MCTFIIDAQLCLRICTGLSVFACKFLEYPVTYSQTLLICIYLYLAYYGEHTRMHTCDIATKMELNFMAAQPGLSFSHSHIQYIGT